MTERLEVGATRWRVRSAAACFAGLAARRIEPGPLSSVLAALLQLILQRGDDLLGAGQHARREIKDAMKRSDQQQASSAVAL